MDPCSSSKPGIFETQNAAPASLPLSFPPSEAANNIIEACHILGIEIREQDIDYWFQAFKEGSSFELKDAIRERSGNAFLAKLVGDLSFDFSVYEDAGSLDAYKEHIKNFLKSNLVGVSASKYQCGSESLPISEGFESRRTKMNTTSHRSPSLDFPVARFLETRNVLEPALIVDVGVGYPPLTTIKTAKMVATRGKVIGVDSTMPDLCIEFPCDSDYHFVLFYEFNSEKNRFLPVYLLQEKYPQTGVIIYDEPMGAEQDFALRKGEYLRKTLMAEIGEDIYLKMARLVQELESHGADLIPTAQMNDLRDSLARFYTHSDIIQGRNKLKFQPMRKNTISQGNLEFRKDDLRLNTIDQADIIRLGNVLNSSYYSQEEATQAFCGLSAKVSNGGVVIIATGDDHSLTFKKQGSSLMPLCCTIMLRYSYGIYDPELLFPGTLGLKEAIEGAVSGVREKSILVGNPMDANAAEKVKHGLEAKGYKASYIMRDGGTWMEIDLLNRL